MVWSLVRKCPAQQKRMMTPRSPQAEDEAAFGIEGCIWGSDWPFINFPPGFRYDAALRALERWLPDRAQRTAVMGSNPARLFGFGG